jgi:hypothetical protein
MRCSMGRMMQYPPKRTDNAVISVVCIIGSCLTHKSSRKVCKGTMRYHPLRREINRPSGPVLSKCGVTTFTRPKRLFSKFRVETRRPLWPTARYRAAGSPRAAWGYCRSRTHPHMKMKWRSQKITSESENKCGLAMAGVADNWCGLPDHSCAYARCRNSPSISRHGMGAVKQHRALHRSRKRHPRMHTAAARASR